MNNQSEAFVQSLNQFLLVCGSKHDLYTFCGTVAEQLNALINYDQARVIFLNESGKIEGSLLYGVKKQSWDAFMEYYSENEIVSSYELQKPLRIQPSERINLCDWTDMNRRRRHKQFYEEYVKPLNLYYCLGFGLGDIENCIRCIITLDRRNDRPYTEEELRILEFVRPHLENLFINLLLPPAKEFSAQSFLMEKYGLTSREKEIAVLLCKGVRPNQISERLCISVTTVYKHIDNLYKKMKITSRQELFARFRSDP